MRPFWVTGWLLIALLACSAVDPRSIAAGVPEAQPSRTPASSGQTPKPHGEQTPFRSVFTRCGVARAQRIDELAAGWSIRKPLLVQIGDHVLPHGLKRGLAFGLGDELILSVASLPCAANPALVAGYGREAAPASSPSQHSLAIPVAWLVRRHATPAAADSDDPATMSPAIRPSAFAA